MLVFKTLKNKKSDFLNRNTCQCSRLYGSQKLYNPPYNTAAVLHFESFFPEHDGHAVVKPEEAASAAAKQLRLIKGYFQQNCSQMLSAK